MDFLVQLNIILISCAQNRNILSLYLPVKSE